MVLTRKYPYSFGEPFLESEISKHLSYYSKICVLAQDVSKDEKQTRNLPEGIESLITATDSRKKLRRLDALHVPLLLFSCSDRMKKECVERKLNIFQKVFLSYFEARCQRVLKETINAIRKIDFEKYDQITIYSYWLFANASIAVELKKHLQDKLQYKGRILLVSRAHRYDIYEEANRIKYLPYRSLLLNELDYIFPCSDDGADYLKNRYTEIKAKIEPMYLGTKDYGLSIKNRSGVFHILSCSRIVKVKGLERLIDSLAGLKTDETKVLWTHIGGGVEGNDNYFNSVKKYAKKKLSGVSFEFLGSMPNEKVYEYYRENQIDLFVNVSYSEGLPVSLMEASSFGIPVIATNVGGSKEIIGKNGNGFLLDKNFKVEDLASMISKLIQESPTEMQARRLAARTIWEEKYNAESNYKKYAAMLASL